MIYFVDIDNTICKTVNSDYANSIPIRDRIDEINKLFEQGHTIIYWTARGANSKINWQDFTNKQLDQWGCLRQNILFNKPHYDIYIDDKSINDQDFFRKLT
jgi:hypothetical protein